MPTEQGARDLMVSRHRQGPFSPGTYELVVVVLGRTSIKQLRIQVNGKLELS